MDLTRADYGHIQELINRLFVGIVVQGITPHREKARLYRGRIGKEKPTRVEQISYPPPEKVVDFQRCNPPGKPMFYCSPDPAAVFYELDVKSGDVVYLSKWSVIGNFWILQIAPHNTQSEVSHHLRDMVYTFFETRFSQRIHQTYSSEYKITSAIAEHMSKGNINNREVLESGNGADIGAISYPSVSHPSRSENLAIRPEIVDRHLKLDYLEEISIIDVRDQVIEYKRTNFASHFPNGQIEWQDKILHWTVPAGSLYKATAEPDGWIVRDEHGNVVNPG